MMFNVLLIINVREGRVAATLELAQGSIRLSGMDIGSFFEVSQVRVREVNGRELWCDLADESLHSPGLRIFEINKYFGDGNIADMQDIVDHFELIESIFAKESFTLPTLFASHELEKGLPWICNVH